MWAGSAGRGIVRHWPGVRLVLTAPTEDPLSKHVGHARQQIVYGRKKGYVFGAFCPRHGRGLQCPLHALHFRPPGELSGTGRHLAPCRSDTDRHEFGRPEYPLADEMLLLPLTHSRWEFVFQPTYQVCENRYTCDIAAGPGTLPCHNTFYR
jgi:hypothetical protein